MLQQSRAVAAGLIIALLMALLAGPTLAHADADEPLATVNGVAVPAESFSAEYQRVSAISRAADPAALALDVLHRLVDAELVRQAAADEGVAIDEAALEAELASLQERLGADGWRRWLEDNHFTAEQFHAATWQRYLEQAMQEHVTAFLHEPVLHARARHILVAREAAAWRLRARLLAGEDFATLAAWHSLDSSTRADGGDLGWFIQGELLDAALNRAAFTRAIGSIGEPVATRLGYHLLQVSERAMRLVEAERLPWLIETIYPQWLAERRDDAEIWLDLAALNSLIGDSP